MKFTFPIPALSYYARFEYDPTSGICPKYTLTAESGYYPPMRELVGRNGKTQLTLLSSHDSGFKKPNATEMRLQGKGSFPFTGLKQWFIDGKLSGFAFGEPLGKETFRSSGKNKPNPFYQQRNDGFLFVVHHDPTVPTAKAKDHLRPTAIELLVLKGGRLLIQAYCAMLKNGGFDEALHQLRESAK